MASEIAKIKLHGRHGAGRFALIDASDLQLVEGFRWYVAWIRGLLYVVASSRTPSTSPSRSAGEWRQIRLHRLVMGVSDPAQFVNNISGDAFDCRKANLRLCTPAESVRTRGILGHSKNRYKGVRAVGRYYEAMISVNRKCFHLGVFDTEEQAALRYDDAARELHGSFGRLNFRTDTSPCPSSSVRHKLHTQYITADGRTQSLSAWARETNVARATIARRLRIGCPPEVAISRQVRINANG